MGYEGWARIALVTMAAVGVMVGFCGDAVAKRGSHMYHRRKLVRHLHKLPSPCSKTARMVRPQPVRLGPMRYYGGPKSPMWRAPADN
jgi:hypothetical protein